MNSAYFLIESKECLAWQLFVQYLAARMATGAQVSKLATELGITNGITDRATGVLRAVVWPRGFAPHPDFKKPRRDGASFPRKGSQWAQEFAAQKGHPAASILIANALNIPLSISWANGEGWGRRLIGNFLNECGFLYLNGDQGTVGMYVPDVPAEVAKVAAEGCTVTCAAKDFRLEFDSCRRIEHEDWQVIALQHEKAERLRTAAAAS